MKHVKIEPYCVLCHGVLALQDSAKSVPEVNEKPVAWWAKVLCFFRDEEHQLSLLQLDWRDWPNHLRAINEHHIPRSRYFCLNVWSNCILCDIEDTMNFAHVTCIQLARQACKGFTTKDLGLLAQINRPVVGWFESLKVTRARPALSARIKNHSKATNLGRLISNIENCLPVEIQDMIYDNVSGLARSLLDCSAALAGYDRCWQKEIDVGIYSTTQVPLPEGPITGKIGAKCVKILGETCLKELGTDSTKKYDMEITLDNKILSGMHVSIGAYGVVGLRFLFEDGDASGWLGGPRGKWSTTYDAQHRRQLEIVSDGFKILRISFESPPIASRQAEPDGPKQVLWDHHVKSSEGERHVLIDVANPNAQVRANPETRLAQYLDLRDVDIHSFTFFSNKRGVRGIQINGDPAKLIGSSKDCLCITWFLTKGESIKSLYVMTLGQKTPIVTQGPHLLVSTTRGRTLHSGPFAFLIYRNTRFSNFGIKRNERITGIFIDPTTASKQSLNSIGVTLKQQNEPVDETSYGFLVPSSMHFLQARFFVRYQLGAFMNRARFVDVKEIHLQFLNSCCKGLRINYNNNKTKWLGQWDPAKTEAVSLLYDIRDGPLLGLWFEYSDAGDQFTRSVKRIEVVTTPGLYNSSSNSFLWEDLEFYLAWWFTDCSDNLERWVETPSPLHVPSVSDIPAIEVRGL